jgi:probable F420-dependent oxidoreductase
MDIGVMIFPTDLTPRPAWLAAETESRGLESIWFPEHTHIPTGRKTPWPGGEPLPDQYRRTLDPFVAMASAAAVTTDLKVGTGICLVAQHHPLVLAKEVASVDLVSDGRLLFGIGVGWNVDEMEHHGVDPKRRRAQVRESVLAMKELWTKDEASYEGEFVQFSSSWSWPKPVQQPHPPVLYGGAAGPTTLRHVVEFCDGWMPIHNRRDILPRLPELYAAAEEAGRDPKTIELGVFGVPPKQETLESYRDAGFSRVVVGLPQGDQSAILATLDAAAKLVGAVA